MFFSLAAGGIYISQTGSYLINGYMEKEVPFHIVLLYVAILINATPNSIEDKTYPNIQRTRPC